jgi:hypothetical protein
MRQTFQFLQQQMMIYAASFNKKREDIFGESLVEVFSENPMTKISWAQQFNGFISLKCYMGRPVMNCRI